MLSVDLLRKEMKTPPKGVPVGRVYLLLGHRPYYAEPPIIAKSHGTANLFASAPAFVYESDLIAGSIRGVFSEDFSERYRKKADHDFFSYGFNHFITNADHYAPNYRTFLVEGIPGTYAKIEKSKKEHTDEKSQRFLTAVGITLDGFSQMIENYAVAADARAAAATTEEAKARFTQMAADLRLLRVSAPQNFRQALQLVFLTYVAFRMEGKNAMALGRIDQYLYPFFEKDVKAGVLTEEKATELLACTFLKIGESRYFGGDDTVNICIGGITPDGKDGVNPLSYCVLAAVKEANIPGPNLSARMHANQPDKFLDECLKVIATGLGYPALMNDEINIPALARHGYKIEDVNDYCFVGCIENLIMGKQVPWSDGRFNVPMFLEPVFFHGETLVNPEYIGIDTGNVEDIKSMDEFIEAYHKQLEFAIADYYASFNSENDRYNTENYSQPFLSIFCDDCIARGKDVRDGGAIYPSVHGAGCIGIATVADSLAAIEKLVFNEKKYTLSQVRDALAADFKGYEEMQKDMLAAPKYGNDDDFVDKYAVWFVEEMDRIYKPYKTRDGGAFYSAIASNIQNISAGAEIGATPDGRNAKEPVSDAASPMHGMDHEGITAVINSTSKPDYKLVSCGTVLNQKFTPRMLNDDECRKKVCDLLKVYFKKGGQEMQINSVSRDVLKDAMKHPENYQNLVVRVSGFSAYYIHLDRSVQLDILKRTEHDDEKEGF
ncbi:MAG: hypothetical protein II368_04010 [Clostridia bacterium]|nr:hypothetical protein [Clostridia bacterium]